MKGFTLLSIIFLMATSANAKFPLDDPHRVTPETLSQIKKLEKTQWMKSFEGIDMDEHEEVSLNKIDVTSQERESSQPEVNFQLARQLTRQFAKVSKISIVHAWILDTIENHELEAINMPTLKELAKLRRLEARELLIDIVDDLEIAIEELQNNLD